MLTDPAVSEVSTITCEEDASVRYLILSGQLQDKVSLTIGASLTDRQQTVVEPLDFDKETSQYQTRQNNLVNDFSVQF